MEEKVLIEAKNLKKYFKVGANSQLHAVDGVNFKIKRGTTLGVVGESGCGKSTLGRLLLRLYDVTDGQIIYDGTDITKLNAKELKPIRARMQMIFQDPMASLNPRKKVRDIIGEGLDIHHMYKTRAEREEKIKNILAKVGLAPEHAGRYPHQFSGGQRQRIGIARALAVEPKFIIADEPVSALDVSIQAQILNILMDLKDEFHFSYLFIAHDLSVVKHISDSLGVMYLGTIVERAPKKLLFSNPVHPYTKALFSAAPTIDEGSIAESQELRGEIPSPIHLPSGCPFHDRCPVACPDCAREKPELKEVEPGHFAACHLL